MPGCPQCGKQWPDGYQRCPEDGATLAPSYGHGYVPDDSLGGAATAIAYASDEDLPAGSFAGEYRIERKIGEGGMGAVYGAKHPLIGKRAAIKVIRRELSGSREAVDRFVLEAQSVNQIGHPNIVDVFGFGMLPDGRSFFVMEWLEGESLRERLQRPLQFPDALEILEQIAKALLAAHEGGVVHRDLKPDNVYLQQRKGEKPTVKLLDFGLAKLTNRGDSGGFDKTRTGVVMGTPLYLSPEQAKGGRIDAATDVYSLGAMAYEMLSGVVPFKADSAVEIMAMHISKPAIPVGQMAPWLPAEIDTLVMQMLEKDSRNRPPTSQVYERIAACRARASVATIAVAVNPNAPMPSSQPPPYAPQVPGGSMRTPTPAYGYAPAPGSGARPPVGIGYAGGGQSGLAPATGRSGTKKMLVVLALLALAGAGLGVLLYVAIGNKKGTSTEQSAAAPEGTPAPTAAQPSGEPVNRPVDPAQPAQPGSDPVQPATPATDTAQSATDTAQSATGSAQTATDSTNPATTVTPAKSGEDSTTTKVTKVEPDRKPERDRKPEVARRGKVTVSFAGPAKAQILVDGKPQGREQSGRMTLELAPGEHTVRVQAKGYKPADKKIRVEPGGSRDVSFTLEKRKSVNAVHDPFAD